MRLARRCKVLPTPELSLALPQHQSQAVCTVLLPHFTSAPTAGSDTARHRATSQRTGQEGEEQTATGKTGGERH